MSKPSDCPKYETCRANICPLDPDLVKRKHIKGEPICYYLRQAAKNSPSPSHGNASETDIRGVEDGGIEVKAYLTLAQIENPSLHPQLSHLGALRRELFRVRIRQDRTKN